MKNIVSKEWLLNNISNDDLIILDARAELNDPEAGFCGYKTGHIKGAQFVSMENTMTGKVETHGGRHPLPDMETFISEMRSLGIKDSSTVVIYDDGDLAMAGRLWWLLKYAGKGKVMLLDGGIRDWTNHGLELSIEVINPEPSESLSLNIDKSMIVDVDHVKKVIDLDNIAIVDSRAYERYSGQVEPLDKVAGHIPNAINLPWTDTVLDGKIMDIGSLKNHFKSLEEFDEIIVHCGSGITGTVNTLFMEEIGLKSKLYPGGYSDWVSYPENIVE